MIPSIADLAAKIGSIGFTCRRCGACCRPDTEDSGLVFLSRDEVEQLVGGGAGSRDEVVVPYPDFIPCGNGSSVTFGWCLRHEKGRCRFLGEGGCTIYSLRPWICRTFPFALVEGDLTISDCPGLGSPISPGDALLLAEALLDRARAEEEDEERVRRAYAAATVPPGRRCIVDSAGLRVLED